MTISYSRWQQLPLHTRVLLSKQFGFTKIGPTHVSDNRIQSDGYKFEDVEKSMNIAAMQGYLSTDESDVHQLFDLCVDKVEGREPAELAPRVVISEDAPVTTPTIETPAPVKRGRKPKTK